MQTFYITTAIDYVNSRPHLGTAYEKITADVIARYKRLAGVPTWFLMGNDEHSLNVLRRAKEQGLDPLAYCDRMEQEFREVWQQLNVSFDDFVRTTEERHRVGVTELVTRIRAAGDIYESHYEGWYCVSCEAFKQEKDLVDGLGPTHKTKPEWIREKNHFFRLSKYQEPLLRHFEAHPEFLEPEVRRNEIVSLIRGGLEDISISRETLTWGVPVPWDENQVIYVWVDALINYLSALTYARPGEDLLARYWPAQVHFLAKDILKFHAAIWPALLMSAGYELPGGELIHGYLLMGGEKMSKTRGNVLDPFAVMDQYGIDPLRFYLFREVTFGLDGVISLEGFEQRYNNELANELGNLVSRTVSMIGKYRGGKVPVADPAAVSLSGLADEGGAMVADAGARFDAWEITGALEVVWEYVRRLNRFVEEEAPWKLAKDEAQAGRLDEVLLGLAGGLRLVALTLCPVVPATAVEILRRLGQPYEAADLAWERARWDAVAGAAAVDQAAPLFPRRDGAVRA